MFNYCGNFNQDIANWNFQNIKYIDSMFNNSINFNEDISKWSVLNVQKLFKIYQTRINKICFITKK